MGTTFSNIADLVLRPSGLGGCQHCDRENVESFDYNGRIIDPTLAANRSLAETEPTIHAACTDCIRGGNLRKSDGELQRITTIIKQNGIDAALLLERYNQTPSIPLLADDDWPICCNTWCEYYGDLATHDHSVNVSTYHKLWQHGPTTHGFEIAGFDDDGSDIMTDTHLFHCLECETGWCLFQPT